MSNLFFTSDEHYGHANIIKFCNRPFKNIWESRDVIVAKHNAKVPKGSITYHLGDMFWRTFPLKEALDTLNALNGQHYFIWGNHDELIERNEILQAGFIGIKDLHVIQSHDPKIVLCHYAMRTWRGSHRGTWQLYGHTHATLPDAGTLNIDVGVDAWDFAPVAIEEIEAVMRNKIALGHEDPMCEIMRQQRWEK